MARTKKRKNLRLSTSRLSKNIKRLSKGKGKKKSLEATEDNLTGLNISNKSIANNSATDLVQRRSRRRLSKIKRFSEGKGKKNSLETTEDNITEPNTSNKSVANNSTSDLVQQSSRSRLSNIKKLFKGKGKKSSLDITEDNVTDLDISNKLHDTTEGNVIDLDISNKLHDTIEDNVRELDTNDKSVAENCTIDLVLSDDENDANASNVSGKNTVKSEDSAIVIEIDEDSMTLDLLDEIIIDREGSRDNVNKETSELINDDVIDITKDEDIQVVEKKENNDDIVVIHANCKKQDEIEFIGVQPGWKKNLSHKWKEKNKIPELLSLNFNASNQNFNCNPGQSHFNAPAYVNRICPNPANNVVKRKRKSLNRRSSENGVNKRNNENKMRRKLTKKKELFLKQLAQEKPKNSQTLKVQVSELGENVYSEDPISIPTSGLRPIVIDGSNVAFSYGNNKEFSCKGLEICINYFKKKGHKVTAFVPQFRVKVNKCDNPNLLEELVKRGDVILTPSRIVDGVPIVSYDDRYIVQFAAAKGGVIVTRDNYNDLLGENPIWDETIKFRLLQFTWVDDFLMFPKDPLGICGPSLQNFLNFS